MTTRPLGLQSVAITSPLNLLVDRRDAVELRGCAPVQWGSRVRKAILALDAMAPFLRVGIRMSYWFIPRTPADEGNIRNTYAKWGREQDCPSHLPVVLAVFDASTSCGAAVAAEKPAPVGH